jgi:hypothetical protein
LVLAAGVKGTLGRDVSDTLVFFAFCFFIIIIRYIQGRRYPVKYVLKYFLGYIVCFVPTHTRWSYRESTALLACCERRIFL